MILALLLAAAEPQTAIDAERAFAADAQKIGQWTAFRKWATADAQMFVPQPTNAQSWLKDKKDPPVAVFWWPGASYVSCDGNIAVNTGPWVREWGKSIGYFTTVWKRQPDGNWKWIYDAGDALEQPRPQGGDIKAQTAACDGERKGFIATPPAYDRVGGGSSADNSLIWRWSVAPDGARHFDVWLWTGEGYETVITDRVTASP